jgi:hypothetical protein
VKKRPISRIAFFVFFRLQARLLSIRYRFLLLRLVSGTINFYSLPFSSTLADYGHDYLLFVTVLSSFSWFRARFTSIRYRFLLLQLVSGTIYLYSLPFSSTSAVFGHDYLLFVTVLSSFSWFRAQLISYR